MESKEKPFLTGHSIYLRMPREEDITQGNWRHWYNDQDTTRYNSHGIFPLSIEQELEIVRSTSVRTDCLLVAIVEKGTDRLLGNAALKNINLLDRSCNLALTIGEPAGMSTGIEAFGLLAGHAFNRLNMNRVSDGTHEKLIVFVHMLKILGFEIEGRGRQHFFRDGRFSDSILFAALAQDFFPLQRERGGSILFDTHEQLLEAIAASTRAASKSGS